MTWWCLKDQVMSVRQTVMQKQNSKELYCSWTKTFHKLENSNPTFSSRGTAETPNTHLRHVAASTRNWTNFKSELTKPREEAPEGSVLIESKHQKRKATDYLKVPKLVTASELKKKDGFSELNWWSYRGYCWMPAAADVMIELRRKAASK